MIASAAVQKLERYGHLGLKRSTLDQFISFSVRDEKRSNIFALTNSAGWKECEGFLRDSQTAFVSEMLLYAMSFGIALVSNDGAGVPSSTRVGLLRSWISTLSLLRRHMVSDSLETTRACAHLCGTALDLQSAAAPEDERALRSDLLSAVLQKMTFFHAKRPQPSLFHVKLLPAALKNRQQAAKETLFQKIARVSSLADGSAVFTSACHLMKQLLSNRPTRLLLYYRGDENKLLLSDVKDVGECNVALFAISGPSLENVDAWLTSPGKEEVTRWAHALPLIFASFCMDSRWNVLATEQKRVVLDSERQQKDRQRAAAVKQKRTRAHSSSFSDTDSINDDDGRELSILETIDTAVMSEMSAASAASFVSFMSKVDPAQMKRGEILQHESGDGNTNLPLIFLEQILVTLHTIVPRLPGDARLLCWQQTSCMLSYLRDSIVSADRDGLPAEPLFDFHRDVRYNRGLGYQSLGVIFAKVVVPYFDSGMQRDADRYVGECLAVFESVAPQVIDENLSSVLSIVTAVVCEDVAATASVLRTFLQEVVRRLAMTNQIDKLLSALFAAFQVPGAQGQAAAKVFLQPTVGRQWLKDAVGLALDSEAILKDIALRVGAIASQDRSDSDPACLSLCAAIIDGVRGSSLAASAVVEVCAEMDLVVSALVGELIAAEATATLIESLQLLFSIRRQVHLCLQDLGVDAVDEFVETLEATLWECAGNGATFVTGQTLEDLLGAVSKHRGKFTQTTGASCVFLLAAQRLALCKLVTVFLGTDVTDPKAARASAKAIVAHILSDMGRCGEFAPFLDALSGYAPRAMLGAVSSLAQAPDLREALLRCAQLPAFVEQICAAADETAAAEDPTSNNESVGAIACLSQLARRNGALPLVARVIEAHSRLLHAVLEHGVNAPDGELAGQPLLSAVSSLVGDVLGLAQTPLASADALFGQLFASKSAVRRVLKQVHRNAELHRFVVCVMSFICTHQASDLTLTAYTLTMAGLLKTLQDTPDAALGLLLSLARRRDLCPRPPKRLRDDAAGKERFDGLWACWSQAFTLLVTVMLPDALRTGSGLAGMLCECISLVFDHLAASGNTPSCDPVSVQALVGHWSTLVGERHGLGCLWRLVSMPSAQAHGLAATLCSTLAVNSPPTPRHVFAAIIAASPTILRLHSALPGAVALVQRALSAGVEAQHHGDVDLFRLVVQTIPRISGIRDVRIATFKSIIKEALAAACAADGHPSAATLGVWMHVSQLLLIPSAALHRDHVLETLAIKFFLVVLDRPVRDAAGWGPQPELWLPIVRNVLSASSSSLLVHGVLLETHALLMPVFVSSLTEHGLDGLRSGVYTGAVASLLVSFFYRMVKSAAANSRADELRWVLCGTMARLLQATSRYVTTFSRFSHELDSFATDMVKYLEKARLPANTPAIRSGGKDVSFGDAPSHGEHSYCDLAFVLIEASDGKNLFRDAMLRAREQEHRVIFNAV